MNADVTKRALARLEERGRACDGCNVVIGRFTSKCLYDEEQGRCYCSTGGCADRVRQSPICACGTRLNPFEVRSVEVPLVGHACVTCAVVTEGESLKGVVDPETMVGKIPERVRIAAAEGPYVVIEAKPQWYQVAYPLGRGKVSVRSTGTDLPGMFSACAAFNEG